MFILAVLFNLFAVVLQAMIAIVGLGALAGGILGFPIVPHRNYFVRAVSGFFIWVGMAEGLLIAAPGEGYIRWALGTVVSLSVVGGWATWVFPDEILGFFYSLTPHPASGMVLAAIHSGAEIDVKNFRVALEVAPRNRIERAVRERQARELSGIIRHNSEKLQQEAEETRLRLRAKLAHRNANKELNIAALDQQLSLARSETLRKIEGWLQEATARGEHDRTQ